MPTRLALLQTDPWCNYIKYICYRAVPPRLCRKKIEQSLFLLCGDFNARTGNLNNSLQDCEEDTYEFIQSDLRGYRQSQDKIVNAFGRLLLEMCATCDLTILNGACPGDELENFRYVCSTGSSTIDYFIRVDRILMLQSVIVLCKINLQFA